MAPGRAVIFWCLRSGKCKNLEGTLLRILLDDDDEGIVVGFGTLGARAGRLDQGLSLICNPVAHLFNR